MNKILTAAALMLLSLVAAPPVKAILPTDRLSYSTMTVTGGTPAFVVPAQGAGIRVAVAQFEVSCSTPATGGTAYAWAASSTTAGNYSVLSSTMTIYTGANPVESPYMPNGTVVTAANYGLVLNVGTASQTCATDVLWFTIQQ